jgi:hypothetical protein
MRIVRLSALVLIGVCAAGAARAQADSGVGPRAVLAPSPGAAQPLTLAPFS